MVSWLSVITRFEISRLKRCVDVYLLSPIKPMCVVQVLTYCLHAFTANTTVGPVVSSLFLDI